MGLLLAIVLALPPTAHEHNERAMDHDEAGRLPEAEAELVAAYASMPDPRVDLEGREQITASLRSVLNRAHAASGEPAPLCRLRAHLRAHVDALRQVFPDPPPPIELTGNEQRLAEVENLLAAAPPGVCEPPDQPAPPIATPATAPPPTARRADSEAPRPPQVAQDPRPRELQIFGAAAFALTGAALGVMTYGLVRERREVAAGRDLDAVLNGRPATPAELADLHAHLDSARAGRQLALAGGISSGIFLTAAVALFVAKARINSQSRKTNPHQNTVQMAPWGSRHGAGLLLRIYLP